MYKYIFIAALTLLANGIAWAAPPPLSIEITGVSGDGLANVLDNLGIYRQKDHPLLNEALIKRRHATAQTEIKRALEPFGYYRAEVAAELQRVNDTWTARYHIELGEPVRVAELRISISGPGESEAALQRWKANFPLQPGAILHHGVYEDAKRELTRLARERGYFDGRYRRHRVTVDLKDYQASINIDYATGQRYFFGNVIFQQEHADDTEDDTDPFDEDFLRRFLTFQPGEPYDANRLLSLRSIFADSDYFQRADVIPLTDDVEDRRIPIQIEITSRKDTLYTAGIGYSTDTGARGRLGFDHRRLNRYGHRLSTILRISEIQSDFTARYHVPLKKPATDTLTYTAKWLDEDTDTFTRTTSSIGADMTQMKGAWLRTIGLAYERERFQFVLSDEERSILLMPHIRFQRLKADQRIATRDGWIFTIGLRGASDAVISNTSFMQVRTDGKYIQGITDGSRVLLRGSSGLSWVPEFTELPASQRFFAGGDQSIRGYAFNSLGPQDEFGRVVGGRHLLIGSVEYEMDIRANLAVAAFYDVGNAYDGYDIDPHEGAGVGLRWRTPIGAIRLDFARALTLPGNPWRLHLTLGPDL